MYFLLVHTLYEVREVIKMVEQKKPSIGRILELIEYGNISQDEAVHRLESLLQAEIDKQDAPSDMELVTACEELLWQIHTHGQLEFEDRRKENQAALMRRLDLRRHRTATIRIGLRVMAVSAAILVLLVVGDGILNREWLSGQTTDDGEQYMIQGQVIDPGLVEDGNAADDTTTSSLTTTKWDEVIAFLETEPTVPTQLPPGWSVKLYYATRLEEELILNVSYSNEGDLDATLLYLWDHYFSAEDAELAMEQNADGEWIEIGDMQVYMTTNIKRNRFVWIDGMTVCSLTTTCELDEVESTILSCGHSE